MILAFNVLHLLEDVTEVIQRIDQLLKKGGYFVALTPSIAERKILNFAWFIDLNVYMEKPAIFC